MANKRQSSTSRENGIRAAIRRSKPTDVLSLEALATIWGCSKANFTRIRDNTDGFPGHAAGPNGSMQYPARDALKAMLAEETKEARQAAELAKRQNRILGRAAVARGKGAVPIVIPIEQLTKISRFKAELDEREREQGLYIPAADVARVIGNVFGLVSGKLSTLETHIDPSGAMPLPQRVMLHTAGTELLLKLHSELRDMLAGNAPSRRRQPPRARKSSSSSS